MPRHAPLIPSIFRWKVRWARDVLLAAEAERPRACRVAKSPTLGDASHVQAAEFRKNAVKLVEAGCCDWDCCVSLQSCQDAVESGDYWKLQAVSC